MILVYFPADLYIFCMYAEQLHSKENAVLWPYYLTDLIVSSTLYRDAFPIE